MENEIRAKLDALLKKMDAAKPGSVNFPLFKEFRKKPILSNKEASRILFVGVRTMANLRKFDGLDYFTMRKRPYHTWPHIIAYIESKF